MTTYESKIESIKNSAEYAFGQLTDLRKLEAYKDRIPEDKLKDAVFTEDSVSVKINPIGNVTLRIIETEPFKTIKFAADNSPIAFN